MKNKKHNKIVRDYDKIKSNHLDILAKKMLNNDEKNENLKKYDLKDAIEKFWEWDDE